MCGIFGLTVAGKLPLEPKEIGATLRRLFELSESRGMEAAGLAVATRNRIDVLKSALPGSGLVEHPLYRRAVEPALVAQGPQNGGPVSFVGHSRLVTSGDREMAFNNHPIVAGGTVGVHNGIIVNDRDLWQRYATLTPEGGVDTEILLRLIEHHGHADSVVHGARKAFSEIRGTASVAVLFAWADALLLATNFGSLYVAFNASVPLLAFASERHILETLVVAGPLKNLLCAADITRVAANEGRLIALDRFAVSEFSLAAAHGETLGERRAARKPVPVRTDVIGPPARRRTQPVSRASVLTRLEANDPLNQQRAEALRRCARCILPETMPFITFDEAGVCNYCRAHRPLEFLGKSALERALSDPIGRGRDADCVVGVSGGRDSLYALHYLREVMQLRPVAYVYDWGMVTDLARRNIARVCGALQIENVIVSANILRKRANIRRNVEAWLARPHLGTIPLFMAGDKQYFYYLRKVGRQMGVRHAVLGENRLERTDFKTGFAGVPPATDPDHVYTLPWLGKARLAAFFGRQFLLNPRFINRSISDTMIAAFCYYAFARQYLNLYRFVPWDEDQVVSTLRDAYDFELAPDTTSSWRIGDGTAAFYNYVYFSVAGFTENDTFRSNQIREGLIGRDEALRLAAEANRPRYESMLWYFETIGLERDPLEVLRIIDAMPKAASGGG